jgi:hypothetical protein
MKLYLGSCTIEWVSNGLWSRNEIQYILLSAFLSIICMGLSKYGAYWFFQSLGCISSICMWWQILYSSSRKKIIIR